MLKNKCTTLRIIVLPSEAHNRIKQLIERKLNEKLNTCCSENKLFIKSIRNVKIPEYGMLSRTNFVISFQIQCTIDYIKPIVGEKFTAVVQNKNQYGVFLSNDFCKAIVPNEFLHGSVEDYQINSEYDLETVDVRFVSNSINCICKFLL